MWLSPRVKIAAAAAVVLAALAGAFFLIGRKGSSDELLTAPEEGRIKVLVVGSSVMAQLGAPLEAALESTGWIDVFNYGGTFGSFGEDDLVNLDAQWGQLVTDLDPDVVLVQITPTTIAVSHCPEGDTACEEEALSRYRRSIVTKAVDVLAAGGAQVVWVDYPHVDAERLSAPDVNQRLDRLAATVAEVDAEDDRLQSIDAAKLLLVDGEFSHWAPVPGGYRQIRKSDGVHLCPYGAEIVADRVAGSLVQGWWDLPDSWKQAMWRESSFFTGTTDSYGRVPCIDQVVEEPQPVTDDAAAPGDGEAEASPAGQVP